MRRSSRFSIGAAALGLFALGPALAQDEVGFQAYLQTLRALLEAPVRLLL